MFNFIKNWFTIKEPPKPSEPQKFKMASKKDYQPPVITGRFANRIQMIREVAKQEGWTEIDYQDANYMISFRKDTTRINVYYSTMTVGTCLNHPKQGKTQLFRRGVDRELLTKLMKNPRQHTGVGYKRKG